MTQPIHLYQPVGDTKGSIGELYVTVTELQSALTGLQLILLFPFARLQARFHFRKADANASCRMFQILVFSTSSTLLRENKLKCLSRRNLNLLGIHVVV
ncbi:hypothetical protein L3X38_008762 [Prunus dulcis]|uniref:Uncharacterized protein n=1 Tax=Prunus dulcis TaxID=3755 RepID=A0AAD4ZX23_PRUDU|nr:hypothetical protein L3X38_008762 [Prunus dulcis]